MPYPYRIIKAIESSVRAQITNALNELALLVGGGISNDPYDASWDGSTDVAPSQNAVYDKIESLGGGGMPATLFDANTILKADTDDTPVALTVAEQTLVGRITGGSIDDLSIAQVRTLLLIEEIFTFDIATVANGDHVLWYDAPFAGAVTKVRTESASGTCTLTGKVNTTALGGTANSVSSTAQEQTHSSTNTFVKGDKLQFTISSNSSCLGLAGAFYMTRTS